ncbi:hypothetical protein SAMN05216553_10685 [Lentzea fradiae]|uniref:Resolvase, N terminal domain n=1 Tax=Lentzea fradiae TaxID=200378 RepID=A0A1G7S7A4_9PSEU|nr:hypothetical protein [Lentzea fradiae]SDG18822.1 hypothetical protein SAMN05216553_10685 [Lentzea fradiae]
MKQSPRRESARLGLRPTVCGYIRVERPDEDAVSERKAVIQQYCPEQDFLLETIFTDRTVCGGTLTRPGLVGVLSLPGVIGAVIPSEEHLSQYDLPLARLRRVIARTSSEVLCVEAGEA